MRLFPSGARTKDDRNELALELGREIAQSRQAVAELQDQWQRVMDFYDGVPNMNRISLVEGFPAHTVPIIKPKIDRINGTVFSALTGSDPYVQAVPVGNADQHAADRVERDVHSLITKAGLDSYLWDANLYALLTDHGILRARVEVFDSELLPTMNQIGNTYDDEAVCAGLSFDFIHPSEFVFYPAFARTIRKARTVGHRFSLRLTEVKELQRSGYYIGNDDVLPTVDEETVGWEPSGVPFGDLDGIDEDRRIDAYEVITKRALDGKYEKYWRIVVVPDLNIILDIEEYDYSRPNYFSISYKGGRTSYWSPGSVGYDLIPTQELANDIAHVLVTGSLMSAFGALIMPKGSFPVGKIKFGPGEIIESDGLTAQDIVHLKIQFDPQALPNMLSYVEEKADSVSGISQLAEGEQLKSGATATEADLLNDALRASENRYTIRASQFLQELYTFVHELYRKAYPLLKGYHGDELVATREEISQKFKWEPNGKSVGNSPSVLMQKLQVAKEIAMQPNSVYDPVAIDTMIMSSMRFPFNPEGLKKDPLGQAMAILSDPQLAPVVEGLVIKKQAEEDIAGTSLDDVGGFPALSLLGQGEVGIDGEAGSGPQIA